MRAIFEYQSNPTGWGLLVKEYLQRNFTSPYHFHDVYELIYIKNSFGKLYVNFKTTDFKEGDIFLLGPGLEHAFFNDEAFLSTKSQAHAIALFFKKDLLGERFFNLPEVSQFSKLLRKSDLGLRIKANNKKLNSFFDQIKRKKGIDEIIAFLEILKIIVLLPSSSIQEIHATKDIEEKKVNIQSSTRISTVIQYIFENFDKEVSLAAASQLVHLDKSAFCRYFKLRMELTFSQFVNKVRIAHATYLLINEDTDVSAICYGSGFNSLGYFNRRFKETYGKSPTEYRAEYHNKEGTIIQDNQSD